jgi:hypothetical protein
MDEWEYGQIDGWMGAWITMDGRYEDSIDGWIYGWTDESMVRCMYVCMYVSIYTWRG